MCFPTVLEAGSPASRYQPVWLLVRALALASCCVRPHTAFPHWGRSDTEQAPCLSLRVRALVPLWGLHSRDGITFPTPHPHISSHWSQGFTTWNLGDKNIQPTTLLRVSADAEKCVISSILVLWKSTTSFFELLECPLFRYWKFLIQLCPSICFPYLSCWKLSELFPSNTFNLLPPLLRLLLPLPPPPLLLLLHLLLLLLTLPLLPLLPPFFFFSNNGSSVPYFFQRMLPFRFFLHFHPFFSICFLLRGCTLDLGYVSLWVYITLGQGSHPEAMLCPTRHLAMSRAIFSCPN